MRRNHRRGAQAALMSLEADAVSARGGFACLFSTSEEYEHALISARRAEGRYAPHPGPWPLLMFIGCALMTAGTVLMMY